MGFAVIHSKPLIFYTSDEINNSHDAYHVNFLSQQLGSVLYNIDKIPLIEKDNSLLKINKYKYKNYLNKYIRHFLNLEIALIWKKIINIINDI